MSDNITNLKRTLAIINERPEQPKIKIIDSIKHEDNRYCYDKKKNKSYNEQDVCGMTRKDGIPTDQNHSENVLP